jgi:twitching motility protein PilT
MDMTGYIILDLLKKAGTLNASDLHITVGSTPIYRVDGELIKGGEKVLTGEDTEQMAKALIPQELYDSFEKDGEVDFSYGLDDNLRFRVNVYRVKKNISIAARVIPYKIPTLEELGMPDKIREFCHYPQGLILVTGPTGSGKSTTIASMINYINRNMKKHIITLEDPIEFLHKHQLSIVNQREVGFDTVDFASGLRASLRQDPDVILVGEMRDLETINIAITAAETGHLVFGTLHTTDAPQTIDRIIGVFPGHQQSEVRLQISSTLVGVISQRLFPKIGGGRIAATEILVNTPAIANLIRVEKVHQIKSVMQTSKNQGMHTLEMSIKELIKQGLVTEETVENYLRES